MNVHISNAIRLAPVIERVHGEHHPELTRVRELTEQLPDADETELETLFRDLRDVTSNYTIPKGACEAFTETYRVLQSADEEYASSQV